MYEIKETYKDWNGEEQTESFLFNLSTADLIKFEMSEAGGLLENLETAVSLKDGVKIMKVIDKLIDASYGKKSPNGRNFIKGDIDPEILNDFKTTVAYSQIYTKLCTNLDYATQFINNIIPKELLDQVNSMTDEEKQKVLDAASSNNLKLIKNEEKTENK